MRRVADGSSRQRQSQGKESISHSDATGKEKAGAQPESPRRTQNWEDYSTPETARKKNLSLRMLMAALVETKQRRIGVVNGISVHRGRRNLEGRNKLEMRKKGTETCCKMALSYKFYNPIFIKKNI